jgi:hypothetical protein
MSINLVGSLKNNLKEYSYARANYLVIFETNRLSTDLIYLSYPCHEWIVGLSFMNACLHADACLKTQSPAWQFRMQPNRYSQASCLK